jgi:hypothetical protein
VTLRWIAAVALSAAAATAGCGGDDGKDPGDATAPSRSAGAKPVGDMSGGTVVQYANCGDWKAGTEAERYATIEVLRDRLTPDSSKTAASPLSDDRAYEVFQEACSQGIDSLRLFKLYVRVQAFEPLYGGGAAE